VRLATGGIEWTSPRGNRYRVDHTGTHYLGNTHATRDLGTRGADGVDGVDDDAA